MQSVIGLGALLVATCWVIVIFHRLGVDILNPYMDGTLLFAYTVVAISLCGMVGVVVIFLIRK